jgi:anti-anti-sigma factor
VATVDSDTSGESVLVRVAGEVDIVGIEDLRAQLPPEVGEGRDVVLDLSRVELLDSTGLAGLLALARSVHDAGGALETVSPHGSESRLVIDMAGVSTILGLRDDDPGAR